MQSIIAVMFLCLAEAQYFRNSQCPYRCECTVSDISKKIIIDIVCAISSINDRIDFSTLETNVSSVLHLDCAPIIHSHLNGEIFRHLYSFIAINIISCEFDMIQEHALFGLKELQELRIIGARNLTIHHKAFLNTPNLRQLTITSSGMTKFPNLNGLTHIEFINFTNNNIEEIMTNELNNEIFEKLLVLILNNNKIKQINIKFHHFFPAIKHIAMADNMISTIFSECFKNLHDLEFLDLSGNNVSALSNDILSDNRNLKVIGLGLNPLSRIDSTFFNSTKELKVLSLDSTKIDDLIWNNMLTLSNVQELQLRNCNIVSINSNSMNRLPLLLYLDLSKNHINEILNHTFLNQSILETLKLSHNNISVLELHAFEGLQVLKNLDLTGNKITITHDYTFKYLRNLLNLNISYNLLTMFPHVNYLENLFVLDLRYNRINFIDNTSFLGLNNLGGINLGWNDIKRISRNSFYGCPLLQLLILSHNNIEVIERLAFQNMNNLKWLFLDHNKVMDISYIFNNLSSLIQLDLSHNSINGTLLAGYFGKSSSLQQIHLRFNSISGVAGKMFLGMKDLQVVDLKYNRIASLSKDSLKFSSFAVQSPAIYLKGNPFNCDCNLAWMRSCLDRWTDPCQALQIEEFEFLHCYTGYKIKSFSLIKNTDLKNMMCFHKNTCDVISCRCCHLEICDCRISCPNNCLCLMSFSHNNGIVDCSNQNFLNLNQSIPSIASTLYLDGNNFTFLRSAAFSALYRLETVFLNNSNIHIIQNDSFNNLHRLRILYLNDNYIQQITASLFGGTMMLEYLNLENNIITVIADDTFKGMEHLKTLLLANNRLVALTLRLLDKSSMLQNLSLAKNSWSCDCDVLENLKAITYTLADIIMDRHEIYCTVNNSRNHTFEIGTTVNIINLDTFWLCLDETIVYKNNTVHMLEAVLNTIHIRALVSTLIMVVLFAVLAVVCFVHRKLLQVVLYSKFSIRICREKSDVDKLYDAFVSYSQKDEQFVVRELIPQLETKEGYKLCVHFRDFQVGASIADSIIASVENSRRTIMVVSNNFLESEWCQYEFKTAHHQVLRDKSLKIIMILMEHIDVTVLDPDLKLYMKTKTYLKRQDPWFWEKIVYAMPDIGNGNQFLKNLDK